MTFQLPWSLTHSFCRSTHHFWSQAHLPYTSDPPTLHLFQLQTATTARGEAAARRALHRCDGLVETRRLVPPNGWWGLWLTRCTSWVDFFRNSTDDCLSCQPDDRPRGFSGFSHPGASFTKFHLPWSKIDLPCTKIDLPYTRFFFSTKSNPSARTKSHLP